MAYVNNRKSMIILYAGGGFLDVHIRGDMSLVLGVFSGARIRDHSGRDDHRVPAARGALHGALPEAARALDHHRALSLVPPSPAPALTLCISLRSRRARALDDPVLRSNCCTRMLCRSCSRT